MMDLVATWMMPSGTAVGALAQASGWTSAYLFCLIVGGGFMLFSLVFGGHGDAGSVDLDGGGMDSDAGGGDLDLDAAGGDLDVGAEASADAGADAAAADAHAAGGHVVDVHHGSEWLALSNWLSLRFLVFFMATFGAVGTILTNLSDFGPVTTGITSVVSGLIVGQGVQRLFRRLQRGPDSSVRRDDYLRRIGRVTVAIEPGRKGEVAVEIADAERFLPATARRSTDRFAVGEQVVITAYDAGTASVVSRKEYEFLHEGETGGEA